MIAELLLADPTKPINVVVAISGADRETGAERKFYYSAHHITIGDADQEEAYPYLVPGYAELGPFRQSLPGDVHFGALATVAPGSLTVVQRVVDTDELSQLHDYTFSRRPVEVYVGEYGAAFDDFILYATIVAEKEPAIALSGDGLEMRLDLASPIVAALNERLSRRRHAGVPTCTRFITTAGAATRAHNAAHSLSRFTIAVRFRVASNPSANLVLFRKQTSLTNCNYSLRMLATSGFVSGVSSTGTSQDVLISTAVSYADNAFHTAVLSRDNNIRAYLMVDDEVIGTHTPVGNTDLPASIMEWGSFAGTLNRDVCEARLYDHYIAPEDMVSVMATRPDGTEPGLVGLWRFDDNAGGTVNDYSSNNLDATLNGTINVDYAWVASDLGAVEQAGQPMPVWYGSTLGIAPQLIDTSRHHYRANDTDVDWDTDHSDVDVYSEGTLLTGSGTDYTLPAVPNDGVFSTVSAEAQPVTMDILGGTAADTDFAHKISASIINERSRLFHGGGDPLGLGLMSPGRTGLWSDQEMTLAEALQRILGNSGHFYGDARSADTILTGLLTPPVGYGPFYPEEDNIAPQPVVDCRGRQGVVFLSGVASPSSTFAVTAVFKTQAVPFEAYTYAGAQPNLGTQFILQVGDLSIAYQAVGTTTADRLRISFGGSTVYSPAGVIKTDVWHFIGVDWDDTTNNLRVYVGEYPVRGVPFVTLECYEVLNTTVTTNPSSSTAYTIGGSGGSDRSWCALQHVSVRSSLLGASGFIVAMNAPSSSATDSNTTFYAPLNEGLGLPVDTISDTYGSMADIDTGVVQNVWAPQFTIDLDICPDITWADREFPRRLQPADEIIVKYARNHRPYGPGEIDSGVSQTTELALRRAWQEVSVFSPPTYDKFLGSLTVEVESPYIDASSAIHLAKLLKARYSNERWVGSLDLPSGIPWSRQSCALELADEVGVRASYPTVLADGHSFRVAGRQPSILSLSNKLALWG